MAAPVSAEWGRSETVTDHGKQLEGFCFGFFNQGSKLTRVGLRGASVSVMHNECDRGTEPWRRPMPRVSEKLQGDTEGICYLEGLSWKL